MTMTVLPQVLTLAEFRATGTTKKGTRTYRGGYQITRPGALPDTDLTGVWCLDLDTNEYMGDLADLEAQLYEWINEENQGVGIYTGDYLEWGNEGGRDNNGHYGSARNVETEIIGFCENELDNIDATRVYYRRKDGTVRRFRVELLVNLRDEETGDIITVRDLDRDLRTSLED